MVGVRRLKKELIRTPRREEERKGRLVLLGKRERGLQGLGEGGGKRAKYYESKGLGVGRAKRECSEEKRRTSDFSTPDQSGKGL